MSIEDYVWVQRRRRGRWMHRSLVPAARPAPESRPVPEGMTGAGRFPSQGPTGRLEDTPPPESAGASAPLSSRRTLDPEITESELRLMDGNR